MRLRQAKADISIPSGRYEEHGTPMWFVLNEVSRAFVKVARIRARMEHPDATESHDG